MNNVNKYTYFDNAGNLHTGFSKSKKQRREKISSAYSEMYLQFVKELFLTHLYNHIATMNVNQGGLVSN